MLGWAVAAGQLWAFALVAAEYFSASLMLCHKDEALWGNSRLRTLPSGADIVKRWYRP